MATKSQRNAGDTGKIALLAGVIVVALAVLAFSCYRSTVSSGSTSGEVKQMQPGVRGEGRRIPTPGTGP